MQTTEGNNDSEPEDVPVPPDDFASASNQATFSLVTSTPTVLELFSKFFSD